MGATKRVAELIVTGFNQRSQSTYCAVRFGNVLGSRGSVIPVFERQIAEGGPVTVTDFRMTRYFMTIPEASRLVIHAGAYARMEKSLSLIWANQYAFTIWLRKWFYLVGILKMKFQS